LVSDSLRKKLGSVFFGAAIALAGNAYASAILPIDTLPSQPTGYASTFASFEWHDLAVGFNVATAGTIKRIQTSLYSRWGAGNFIVGIASNELIGNPSAPTYFEPPPGSIKEYTVCSSVVPPNEPRSPCDYPPSGSANDPNHGGDYQLGANQPLEIIEDIFLPNAGTYWIYTRYILDDVFNSWGTNNLFQTDLIATRVGYHTGEYSNQAFSSLDDRTFYRVGSAQDSFGLRVEFEPGLRLPIPSTVMLLALGGIALFSVRRKRRYNH
jgi:hypothetical protein